MTQPDFTPKLRARNKTGAAMFTDGVRKLHTGGTKAEFPWAILGLGVFALHVVALFGALAANALGY
ncbi:hypothetical protein [Bradyrhizobium elkanii]|uniref:hypothetical protein n=1 Tax=Bradyrhizobium elkanii TaxID=29448 RepID=UPI003516C28A